MYCTVNFLSKYIILGGSAPASSARQPPIMEAALSKCLFFTAKSSTRMLSNPHSFSVNIKRNFIRFVCMRDQKKKNECKFFSLKEKYSSYLNLECCFSTIVRDLRILK